MSDETPTSHSEQPPTAGPEQGKQGFGDLRHYVPSDLLNPSFPIAVRGYNRESVEDYVKRANRVIAELKVGSSPRAAKPLPRCAGRPIGCGKGSMGIGSATS